MSTTYVEPEDIAQINQKLLEKFGKVPQGKVKFRLVWSEAQTEHRKLFHSNGIQLLYPIIKEVEKYPYARNLWILERWIAHHGNQEIVTMEGGTYEPVWTFRDTKGKPLRPVWPAVELIGLAAEGRLGEKTTLSDEIKADENALDSEIKEFEDMLGDGRDYGNQTDAFVAPMFVDSTKVFRG